MLATHLLPQFKCHTCNKQAKEQRGCTAKPKLPLTMDDEELDRCPLRAFLEDPHGYNDLFHRHRMAKEGYLSDPGLWPDQSAAFVELSTVIMQATDEANESNRRKKEREANEARRAAAAKGSKKVPHVPKVPRARKGRRPRR